MSRKCKKMKTEKINVNPITVILIGYALAFCGYEAIMRYTRNDTVAFAGDCVIVLLYCLGIAPFVGKMNFTLQISTRTMICVVIAFVGQVAINLGAVIGGNFHLNSVSKTEAFMFYVAIAAGEEALFRVLPVFGTLYLGRYITKNTLLLKIIGVIMGGVAFGLSHLGVYGSQPAMIWGTTFVGIFLGIMMLVANNDPTVNIMSHMLYNALTSMYLIV